MNSSDSRDASKPEATGMDLLTDEEEELIFDALQKVPKGTPTACPLCSGTVVDLAMSPTSAFVQCSLTPRHRYSQRGI